MNFAKILSRALACTLVVSRLVPVTACAVFDGSFTYSYPVSEGLQYSRTEGSNAGGLQKANILTYTPNPHVTPIMEYASERLYGSKTSILDAVQYLKQQGKTVAGGTNADFFVMSSGIPIGLVIDEGELVSSDAWQYAIGFRADGTAVLGQPTMEMYVTGASGSVLVSYFNKTRTTFGAYLLDRHYDDSTHFSANGTYILLERLEETPVKVNGQVKMKVVNKGHGNTPFPIADNQMVLTKSDGADVPSWVDFPIGEEVSLRVTAGDTAWETVRYAVGGKLLLRNGAVTTEDIDAGTARRARTAIGVKADGTVILYEIDGNQASYSAGLTAAELGTELKELGCVNAVCLDGGGSSVMALRRPGGTTPELVSRPSDGAARACANYIFFQNHTAPDGVTAHAVLTPSFRYVLPGASTMFTIQGADASYGAAPAPGGLQYTVSDGLGTVSGQTFTAGSKTGTAVITGSNGTVTGSMMVSVTGAVTSIKLLEGENELHSVFLRPNGRVDLTAVAYRNDTRMASVDTAFQWSVSGNIGTVDQNGVFTAQSGIGLGSLTCSYGGTKQTIPVTVLGIPLEPEHTDKPEEPVPEEPAQKPADEPAQEEPAGIQEPQQSVLIADFETTQPFTAAENISLARETERTAVARGEASLQMLGDGPVLELSVPAADVTSMHYLTTWARTENVSGTLTAVFAGEDGQELIAVFSAEPTAAWTQITAAIPAHAKTLTGLRFAGNHTGTAALYLDHIVASAQHAVTGTSAPTVTLENASLTVAADASAVIRGTALMEQDNYTARASNFSVRIDGKTISDAAQMQESAFTVTTGALEAGTHCVTIDVSDDAGNRTRVAATVTAGDTGNAFVDTTSHWARGYAALLQQNGTMQGETVNDSAYFRPERNLRRVEFAVTMARLLGLDTSYTGPLGFTDEDSIPAWAHGAVYAVSQAGIMNGKPAADGTLFFAPEADMTRAEVMTVIGRCLPRGYEPAALSYTDAGSIPDWAAEQVQLCVSTGIIGGYQDHTIRPLGKITRGEIAKILAFF